MANHAVKNPDVYDNVERRMNKLEEEAEQAAIDEEAARVCKDEGNPFASEFALRYEPFGSSPGGAFSAI